MLLLQFYLTRTEVLTENQNLQMELVKKIKKSRELKIPKVDSDAWD